MDRCALEKEEGTLGPGRQAVNHQKQEKGRKSVLPSEPLEGTALLTLEPGETDFGLLTSRTGGEYICSVVSSDVDGNLLQWQWEMNTADGYLWVKV